MTRATSGTRSDRHEQLLALHARIGRRTTIVSSSVRARLVSPRLGPQTPLLDSPGGTRRLPVVVGAELLGAGRVAAVQVQVRVTDAPHLSRVHVETYALYGREADMAIMEPPP
jgi:hypothetical protein